MANKVKTKGQRLFWDIFWVSLTTISILLGLIFVSMYREYTSVRQYEDRILFLIDDDKKIYVDIDTGEQFERYGKVYTQLEENYENYETLIDYKPGRIENAGVMTFTGSMLCLFGGALFIIILFKFLTRNSYFRSKNDDEFYAKAQEEAKKYREINPRD